MNTQELIAKYRKLNLTDPVKAAELVVQNRDNELFVSLVELRQKLVPAIMASIDRVEAIATETAPELRRILAENLANDISEEIS